MARVQQRGGECVPTQAGNDDVDDREGEPNLELGNEMFRLGKYEEAIKVYSGALRSQSTDSALLLSNRCAAYCRLSERLRISAHCSEERVLDGLDPTSLVQLALKDAEKLLKQQNDWPKAHLRKGKALVLLEQYDEGRDSFLNGLQLDPSSKALQTALRALNAEFGDQLGQCGRSEKMKYAKLQRSDELDCSLCLKLLYNPLTTSCGHSFCRACLLQAMDHGNKCPMCRTVLFISAKSYPVSVTLKNLIQRNFPEEYEERKAEMDELILGGEEILPLFEMDVVLPPLKMKLNIFELRYRLMVRRIMEGNHRMGMVGIDSETGVFADTACEVEICECQPLPDGRFHLEVESRRRFSIIKSWQQDGYWVAQVEWIEDVIPPDGSSEKEQMKALVKDAAKLAKSWISGARDLAREDRQARLDVINRVEEMSDSSNAETFSFWIANLLRIRPSERLQLLRLTDTRERLIREMELLRECQGCNVQ